MAAPPAESPRAPAVRTPPRRAAACALALVALGPGCTTTLRAPAPDSPLPVFVLDHGRHASLVLPAEGASGIVRYSYGDWRYYARNRTGVTQASAAVLWPTRAALGRRALDTAPEPDAMRGALRVGVDGFHEVPVEAAAVERLRARLDSLFEAGRATLIYNDAYDLEFVHHPRRYWILRNSNHVVAGWLRELGVEVKGFPVLSRWRVERHP